MTEEITRIREIIANNGIVEASELPYEVLPYFQFGTTTIKVSSLHYSGAWFDNYFGDELLESVYVDYEDLKENFIYDAVTALEDYLVDQEKTLKRIAN